MVRLPRGFHPQAARRATSKLGWAPGWRGTGQQPIRAVQIGRYTRKISGVPLTGGQASGVIASTSGTGTVKNPAINFLIASAPAPAAGTFQVSWSVTVSGTLGVADVNSMQLWRNSGGVFTLLATASNPAVQGTYPQPPATVALLAGDLVQVYSSFVTPPTAGAVYSAFISVGSPLTLQVGPQGLATTWYPAQVTLSTSTGALDTSTANIYLGPAITPATQVGQVFTGNGTAALAIPAMQPGQTIIVQWLNGHLGDTAAMNVIGTMDALGTG